MSRKRNKIEGQFVARTSEMLQSPAFRVLSLSAHRMLARIEIEHCSHGGNDNGRLPVTYDQFVEYGIHRDSIPPASRELEAVGLMEVTERGSAGNREFRRPNLYRLTYLPVGRAQPTHDWRRFKTVEQALEAIRGIRPKKQNSSHGFRQVSVMDSRTGNGQFSVMDSGLTPVMDSRTTSISRVHACERTGRRPRRPRPPPATRNTADPSTGPSR